MDCEWVIVGVREMLELQAVFENIELVQNCFTLINVESKNSMG